jgi:hypothetical protein
MATAEQRVEVVETEHGPRLLVDGVPMRHGVLPDGLVYLRDYAYDPAESLEEVGRRYVAYRDASAARHAARAEGAKRAEPSSQAEG